MSKKISVWSWIPSVFSLLLLLGTMTVFHACERKDDGTWMHCHTAQVNVTIVAAVMLAVFVAAALVKNKALDLVLNLAGIAGAVIAFLMPGTIVSMCMMNTMRCYTVMQPFVRIVSVLVILGAVINIVRLSRR